MHKFKQRLAKGEPEDHLLYLHPLDHGKQVRGLGKRVDTDPKRDMGLISVLVWFPCGLQLSFISAHWESWLCCPNISHLNLWHPLISYFTVTALPNVSPTPLDTNLTEALFNTRRLVPSMLEDKHTVNKYLLGENKPQSSMVPLSVATATSSSGYMQQTN